MLETQDRVDYILNKLKKSKKKLTPQRKKVIQILFGSFTDDPRLRHPTAEEIFQHINGKDKNLSRSTVYNTLQLLKEEKLIEDISLFNSKNKGTIARYETNPQPHFNLVCYKCQAIEDLFIKDEIEGLGSIIQERTGFEIKTYQFHGLCGICQRKH